MKKHFNKNFVMVAEEEGFERSNICWICRGLIDFTKKVRDHCRISRKFRSPAHWSSNINLKII